MKHILAGMRLCRGPINRLTICLIALLIWGVAIGWSEEPAATPAGSVPDDEKAAKEPAAQDEPGRANLTDLSLEELMEVEIKSSATLTDAKPRLAPAAITTITAGEIEASGARSLFELLDIYVPNLQWLRHHWEADTMGLRGIMGDRDDKYLLLVNGVMMNERTHYGVLSEKDLVQLKDIHHIDVVRGPGSSLYGPGAVSMVINIITFNSDTFQGTDITTRAGAIEEFYSTEIRHGRKFTDGDGGIFAYMGIGKYNGADSGEAPQIYGFDFPSESSYSWWNPDWGVNTGPEHLPADGTAAGDPMTGMTMNNDGGAYRNIPPTKLYGEVRRDDWTFWGRYTLGGKTFPWDTGELARSPYGWADWIAQPLEHQGYGYQQATLFAGKKTELSAKTILDTSFSYNLLDTELMQQNNYSAAYREDRYTFKSIVRHEINDRHKIAVGGEVLHQELGIPSLGWPQHEDVVIPRFGQTYAGRRWATDLLSLMGEHQWTLSDHWTTFVSARVDEHTFTNPMFSPRGALIYTPTEKDTLKLIWARSVRANFEEEMKLANMLDGATDSAPEKMDSVEFRYERKVNEHLDLAVNPFVHYNLELMGWNDSNGASNVGTQRDYGLEVEAYYHTDRTRIGISHGYTKLYDFSLAEGMNTIVTGKPYGYGDDLARWSNHITKLTARHKLDDFWTVDGSLRVYWGFPGMKDFMEYRMDSSNQQAPFEPDWQRAYRGNYYLNLGAQYQPVKNLTCRLDGYNLLGIFNQDFNKRNYGGADFRSHAVAIGLSVAYRF